MKLRNYTLKYLSLFLPLIIGVWAAVFYFNMIDEVYDSIDDGLDNYKTLIIKKALEDSSLLHKSSFGESNYLLKEIGEADALAMRDVYKDTSMYMLNEEDFEPVRMLTTAFAYHEKYYELKVISSMVEEDDLVEDLLYSLIGLYIVLLASMLIINNLLLEKLWKPFYVLLEDLKNFRLHKQEALQVPHSGIDEFNKLNEAVSLMTANALETYKSQKQFIENASHELQTPLAISINKLELLSDKMVDAPSAEQLVSVIETLERLTRLNKSLLLLSKIENRQFNDHELVDFNVLCRQQAEDFADFASFREVVIHIHENEPLKVKMDKGLASVLVTNLLKNAIVHNIKGGSVEITLDQSELRFSNSGKAGSLDGEKIFRRFYKDSPEKNTTGLGLAIVKAITGLYGFSIRYEFTGGKHRMIIRF